MLSNLYQKTEKAVIEAFEKAGLKRIVRHVTRTSYWTRQLSRETDEVLAIAGLLHDIERAYNFEHQLKIFVSAPGGMLDKDFLKNHQEQSAACARQVLEGLNAPQEIVDEVCGLVLHHEEGGTEKQNILKDADSVSFFEDLLSEWGLVNWDKRMSEKTVLDKINWMYDRITSPQAKQLCEGWYREILKQLPSFGFVKF